MTLVITHPYVSSVTETTPSGGPGGNVGPSEWNANHTLTGLVSPAQGGTGITSGTGVTFFSSATVIADSGTLTANAVVLGGGANTAPTVVGTVGTTSQILYGGAGGAAPQWVSAPSTSATTPGGANTNVQFNNSSAFGGDANFTYTSGGGGVSVKLTSSTSTGLAGLSIATSSSSQMQSDAAALKITATWNSSSITYDAPLFMNITPTLNAAGSRIFDAQLGSTTLLTLASTGLLALANGVSPASIQVFNTVDNPTNPTNYERGIFDWTVNTNVLRIGTQAGGTGTVRTIEFYVGTFKFMDCPGVNNLRLGQTTVFGSLQVSVNGGFGAATDASISFNNAGQYEAVAAGSYVWAPSTNPTAAPDTGLFRATAKVVEFSDGAANANGWMNWVGQARVTSNVTSTTTSFADITGMKVTLQASRSYSFRAEIIATCSSSGGIQVAASSTTTSAIPTIQVDGYAIDGGNLVRGYSQQSTLNSAIIASTVTGTALHAHVWGTVTTTTTGASFKLQVAQQNLSATQTIVLAGSYMLINDTP